MCWEGMGEWPWGFGDQVGGCTVEEEFDAEPESGGDCECGEWCWACLTELWVGKDEW